MPAALPRLDVGVERQLAAGLFNQVWVLLDKPGRSAWPESSPPPRQHRPEPGMSH